MLMARMRGPGRRGKDRSRATAAVLISATVVLAVLVGVGVVALLHSRSTGSAQGGQLKLSNKITSQLSVGLANLGRTGRAGSSSSSATLLYAGAGGLIFTPSSGGGETVPSSQQWQADQNITCWGHGLPAPHFCSSATTAPPDDAVPSPRQRPSDALRSAQ